MIIFIAIIGLALASSDNMFGKALGIMLCFVSWPYIAVFVLSVLGGMFTALVTFDFVTLIRGVILSYILYWVLKMPITKILGGR